MTSITRSGGGGGSLSAGYTYNADNSVATITYGNGATVTYSYDDAGRVTGIGHASGGTILQLGYTYSADGLITQITELDGVNPANVTTYGYDNRNRLIEEERTGANPYDLEYTYDQGGNRTGKIDSDNQLWTAYHYDTDAEPIDIDGDEAPDDPRTYYGSLNNRLMWYDVFDTSGQGDPLLVEKVLYEYQGQGPSKGHPTRIVHKLYDSQTHEPVMYQAADLTYNHQGELCSVSAQVRQSGFVV